MYVVKLTVKSDSIITNSLVKLDDISEISTAADVQDDVILALQRIVIAESPQPGNEKRLTGEEVLEKIRQAGVDLKQVGYTIPQEVAIRRAGRILERTEVQEAISAVLNDPDAELKRIDYRNNIMVPTGAVTIKAAIEDNRRSRLTITAREWQQTFTVGIELEEWKDVPVATRQIRRGELINNDDVSMARLEIGRLGPDFADSADYVVGKEAQQDIRYGEVFRKGRVKSPPMIAAGEKVVLKYVSNLLEATASGVAIDNAAQNEPIRVRNESSKKIVLGEVENPGVVIVRSR